MDVQPGQLRRASTSRSRTSARLPVSLAGWSFDDDSKAPGTVPLDSLGTLAAGESAIITESADATFRSEWGLGADVKILAGNTTNLGRADEINIFDGPDAVANLVDRLTYNDQGTGTVKGPRTQGVAGIPTTEAALGANDASQWQLSAVGDAEASWASTTGDIGSPGKSRFAPAAPPAESWTHIRINEVSSDNGAHAGRRRDRAVQQRRRPTSASRAGCRSTAAPPPRRPRSRRSCPTARRRRSSRRTASSTSPRPRASAAAATA